LLQPPLVNLRFMTGSAMDVPCWHTLGLSEGDAYLVSSDLPGISLCTFDYRFKLFDGRAP
jgi:hypothetical protein